jgi:hypothetical protein
MGSSFELETPFAVDAPFVLRTPFAVAEPPPPESTEPVGAGVGPSRDQRQK